MSGLGNVLQASVIKSFIPMIKENLPKLETQIGEVCTFDIEDHLCRQVRSIPLAEFVEQILTGKFTI